MIALYTFALTLGASLSSGLSAPLQSNIHSWSHTLALWAIFALIALPIWWLFVSRRIDHSKAEPITEQTGTLPWNNKRAWLLTFSFGLMAMIFYSLTAWIPPMVQSMGYSKLYAGTALTIFTAIQLPVSLLLPFLLKRVPSKLVWLLIASTFEFAGLIMFSFGFHLLVSTALIGIGAGILFPLNLMLPIALTSNARDAAAWSAMTQSVGYLLGAAGPFIIGLSFDLTHSFFAAITGLMILTLIMMVIQVISKPESEKRVSKKVAV